MKRLVALIMSCLLLSLMMTSCGGVAQSEYDHLKSQNDNLQKQLTQSQQNVTQLQAQLTQAQQKVTELQTKLNQTTVISPPPPPPGKEVNVKGDVWGGGYASIPIVLNQNEKVQGEITKPYLTATIQNPDGKTIKDLGSAQVTQFSFNADLSGRYLIVLNSTNSNMNTAYSLKYWVYSIK